MGVSRQDDFDVMPTKEALAPGDAAVPVEKGEVVVDKRTSLHRGLRSRHTTMIGENILAFML